MQLPTGLMEKTEAGRREVSARPRTLTVRVRALLIMVDGRTSAEELLARAARIGAQAEDFIALQRDGLIRPIAEPSNSIQAVPACEMMVGHQKVVETRKRRSVALARLYLIDVMERMLGASDHPVRRLLVGATDEDSVERAFVHCHAVILELAAPAMAAEVEAAFRDLMPTGQVPHIPGVANAACPI